MNQEPSPADVAAVNQTITPQPAQMQPAAPTPQPAPSQQPAEQPSQPTDPFANFGAPQTPPAQPAPQAPAQPVEPVAQPTQPPAQQPTQPTQQPAQQPAQPTQDYQTYEEYMAHVMEGLPESPQSPDPSQVNPDDPAAIKGFFDDLVNTAVQKAISETNRRQAIQNSEKRLWDDAMDKYGSLRSNKQLRDTVHAIRMGYFNRGIALTPTQAAEKLLESMGNQYRQGIADNQVVTSYEQVQPNGGGSGAPVPTTLDKESILTSIQSGGETALADILDAEIKAGRL